MSETALYRFYDGAGDLLYVGISIRPWDRWKQHRGEKEWWHEVKQITLDRYPDVTTALSAERAAIVAESPRYNVVHNRGTSRVRPAPKKKCGGRWWVENRRYDTGSRQTDLALVPEPNGLAVLSHYDYLEEIPGDEQVAIYVDYLRREKMLSDRVQIYWCITGTAGIFESAPVPWSPESLRDFSDFFHTPYDVETGEECNFFTLPTDHRFPDFWDALGYEPSPLQRYMPMESIVRGRFA